MNEQLTNNTRCYPRTLVAAFGPYATWDIEPQRPFLVRHAWSIGVVVFFLVVAGSLAIELLKGHA